MGIPYLSDSHSWSSGFSMDTLPLVSRFGKKSHSHRTSRYRRKRFVPLAVSRTAMMELRFSVLSMFLMSSSGLA